MATSVCQELVPVFYARDDDDKGQVVRFQSAGDRAYHFGGLKPKHSWVVEMPPEKKRELFS